MGHMKKIKSKSLLAVTFFITLGALTLPFITSAAPLIKDIFADGNSQNQNLANNSIRMFNGRAGTTHADPVGSEGFRSFFTDGTHVSLGVGAQLSVQVKFTAQNINPTNNFADLRFGIFDSNKRDPPVEFFILSQINFAHAAPIGERIL
jgi:hypothetical protein